MVQNLIGGEVRAGHVGVAGDVGIGKAIDLADRSVEVGVDLVAFEIAHHEQRWILQRPAILLQLLERFRQGLVLSRRLVLDGEMILVPHIGEAIPHDLPGLFF